MLLALSLYPLVESVLEKFQNAMSRYRQVYPSKKRANEISFLKAYASRKRSIAS